MVKVSRESQDTQTGEGKLCPSRDDRGMVGVSLESLDTHTEGENKLCPSRDDSVMVGVSQESQDIQTEGRWAVSIPG